ncbi:MAG: hypothetical protein ACFE8B_03890 [Candidatus Hermodarchaeota archaeon]
MSKKILIISALFLALGTGLVPSGIFIEDYINELVVNSADEGLLGIEERGIPLIEPMIKEKGIPQALRGIRDKGITVVGEMVEMTFVAVLIELMAITGGNVSGTWYDPLDLENFFNNDTDGVWFILNGVSRYHGVNLSFSEDAQNRLLYGNSTIVPGFIPGIQGFLNDTSTGAGVATFLTQFNEANSSLTNDLNLTMQENYNCSWIQLMKLEEYITDYLITSIIPLLIMFDLHAEYMPALKGLNNIDAIGKALFMEQWANGTILGEILYPEGIDFSEMLDEINETLIGFEVGRNIPSNITRKIAYALFDEDNYPNALTNDTGIELWIVANINDTIKESLMNEFNLTQPQMDKILFWLFEESFQDNIVPELMKLPSPDGVGMNITEYARVLLLEQWANGTADGEVVYPFGFPLPLKAGTRYGFEVGYQGKNLPVLPTNMSLATAESLWDVSNEFSLVNKNGLKKWYSAVADPTSAIANELQTINSLEDGAMDMILSWLPDFRDNLMPYLAQEEMDLPMDSISYSNSIELGMVIPGSILMGLGLLGLARNAYIKRKINQSP